MARYANRFSGYERVSDFITLGALLSVVKISLIEAAIKKHGKEDQRIRKLPSVVIVIYVIAMALYREYALEEVFKFVTVGIRKVGHQIGEVSGVAKSAISAKRTAVGSQVLKELYESVAQPIGKKQSIGVWYKELRVVSCDGSVLDVPDTQENEKAFGKPGASRGEAGFPQIRFCALCECGTHALFNCAMGSYSTGEVSLAKGILSSLKKDMLCICDRGFFGFSLWTIAKSTGAQLLWRVKENTRLRVHKQLADGSYLSHIYSSPNDYRKEKNGSPVRVIEYTIPDSEDPEKVYRLVTTILGHVNYPASELAELYMQRWEIENTFDEFKTHLKGSYALLRSKTPDLIKQEFYGFMLAHFAVRSIMHEAALEANRDPDTLSFTHSLRVLIRRLPELSAFSPSAV